MFQLINKILQGHPQNFPTIPYKSLSFFQKNYQVHPEKFSTFGYNPSSFSQKLSGRTKKNSSRFKKLFKY